MLLLNSLKSLLGFFIDSLKLFLIVSIDCLLHLMHISSLDFRIWSWISSSSLDLLLHHWNGGWVQSWNILNRLMISRFRIDRSDLRGLNPSVLWWPPLIPWWFWILGTKWILREASPRPISDSSLLCISIGSLAILFDWLQFLINWLPLMHLGLHLWVVLEYRILPLLVSWNLNILGLSLIPRNVVGVTISVLTTRQHPLSINHIIIIFIFQSWSLDALLRVIDWLLLGVLLLLWRSVSVVFVWHVLSWRFTSRILVRFNWRSLPLNFNFGSWCFWVWQLPLSSRVWRLPGPWVSSWLSRDLLVWLVLVLLVLHERALWLVTRLLTRLLILFVIHLYDNYFKSYKKRYSSQN